MGGCVAQAFAASYPNRTQGLGLVDTTAWYGPNAPDEWRKRAEAALSDGLSGLAEFQTTRWFSDAFRKASPDFVQRTMRVFLANDLQCYAATCAMLGDTDLRSYLPNFRTPIAAAEALHRGVPEASLTVLQGGRHLTPIECPKPVADELRSLIDRVHATALQ